MTCIRSTVALLALMSTACAAPELVPVNVAPQGDPIIRSQRERPIPNPVVPPPQWARAVANGTRTETGEPGPSYWTQYAEYDIRTALDPGTRTVTGTARIRYHNRSPDTLDVLRVHLRQNTYAPGAVRNRTVNVTGGMGITRIVVQGREMEVNPAAPLGSVVTIALPDTVPPLADVELEVDWSFVVPPTPNFRMGTDGEVYYLAYWYPQIAVYDDVHGWVADPYMGNGEFYMGYADYDVAITAPAGWLVAATGVLQNPGDVLTERTRERLARAASDTGVVRVVAPDERGAASATAHSDDGTLTWRFHAENVRDFAWGASASYVWDATHADVGDWDGDGAPDTAAIHAVYRPDRSAWRDAAAFARHVIEFFSGYIFPYPYPHMTAVEGIIGGGMEYPMISLMGGSTEPERLYGLFAHELGHEWFPMLVGSDEKGFTWMDEGLTSFIDEQASHDRWDAPLGINRGYLRIAGSGNEVEMMRHADRYPPGSPARGIAGYGKPASVMHMLRAMLGEDTFNRAFRRYARQWRYRHPQPYDLFNTFEAVTGQDMDWFWTTWFFETWHLDQAVRSVATQGDSVVITIEDRGLAPMPVVLDVTREDGATEQLIVPVDVWLAGHRTHTVSVLAEPAVTRVEIDAGEDYADVDRANNVWSREG